MEVVGLRNNFFHVGAEHTHPIGKPKHPHGAQQGAQVTRAQFLA
jgi:hypothetical protein